VVIITLNKETVDVTSSEPLIKELHARFPYILNTSLSDSEQHENVVFCYFRRF